MPAHAETAVLVAHALATTVMAGVIWSMQLVHYPLLARVPASGFVSYEREHMTRITWLVGPTMLIELATATVLALAPPAGTPALIAWLALGMLLVIWVATATTQGPIHHRLAAGGLDQARIRRLVSTNWLRTALWTARSVLALLMLAFAGAG